MRVSVCITVFNESQESINKLLSALSSQTLKPDEIIIIDAKDYNNCSRSKGRNIAIQKSKNEIIVITDAGCTPHNDWLEKITAPFKKGDTDVVAGAYRMVTNNDFEKSESIFLGVKQQDMKEDFMPSARSMALTKSIWKKAGGFPEDLNDTAEDTVFNLNLIKVGAKFTVAKNAVVDWYMPNSIYDFAKKIYKYAKGDVESGIWWHPVKKIKTHNIKALTVFLRYLILIFVLLKLGYPFFLVLFFVYILWAHRKAGWWGIILQFVSDFAIIFAGINYLFNLISKRKLSG